MHFAALSQKIYLLLYRTRHCLLILQIFFSEFFFSKREKSASHKVELFISSFFDGRGNIVTRIRHLKLKYSTVVAPFTSHILNSSLVPSHKRAQIPEVSYLAFSCLDILRIFILPHFLAARNQLFCFTQHTRRRPQKPPSAWHCHSACCPVHPCLCFFLGS